MGGNKKLHTLSLKDGVFFSRSVLWGSIKCLFCNVLCTMCRQFSEMWGWGGIVRFACLLQFFSALKSVFIFKDCFIYFDFVDDFDVCSNIMILTNTFIFVDQVTALAESGPQPFEGVSWGGYYTVLKSSQSILLFLSLQPNLKKQT